MFARYKYQNKKKYAPKEGRTAAYQEGSILQVQSIVIVSRLTDFGNRPREEQPKKKKTTEFGRVLEEAVGAAKPKEVKCVSTGYTKYATKTEFLYDKREYNQYSLLSCKNRVLKVDLQFPCWQIAQRQVNFVRMSEKNFKYA